MSHRPRSVEKGLFPVHFLRQFWLARGSLASLHDNDVLKFERLVHPSSTVSDNEVSIFVPVHLLADRVNTQHLSHLTSSHGIPCKVKALNDVYVELIRAHVCGSLCCHLLSVFQRPSVSQFDPFGLSTSSPLPNMSLFRTPSGTCTPPCETKFPPDVHSKQELASFIRAWTDNITPEILREVVCAVCAQIVNNRNVELARIDSRWFDHLSVSAIAATKRPFPPTVTFPGERILCAAGYDPSKDAYNVCHSCRDLLCSRKVPRLSLANGMWVGDVPEELQHLTLVEKLLVARYRHNVCVVNVRMGQRKLRSNAVVFSQPVAQLCKVLPPPVKDLESCLLILFTGAVVPDAVHFKRTPFIVRRTVVMRALHWLVQNHRDYGNVVLSADNIREYPEDKPAVAIIHVEHDGSERTENLPVFADSVPEPEEDDSSQCPFTVSGLTIEEFTNMTADARKAKALQLLREGQRMLAYGHAQDPQSMYGNPSLYPGMFPWLFPYGYGGFSNSFIKKRVGVMAHTKSLLLYHDRRFQTDEYFLFVAFNQEQIRSSTRGGYLVSRQKTFPLIAEQLNTLSIPVLERLVTRAENEHFLRPVQDDAEECACFSVLRTLEHVAGHVSGSPTQRKYQRNEIRSLVIRDGEPTIFVTFSPVDIKNPICMYFCGYPIDVLSSRDALPSVQDRMRSVAANPVACAKFFDLTVRLFIKHILKVDSDEDGLFGPTKAYYGTVESQGRLTLHLHMLVWIRGSLSSQQIRDRLLDGDVNFRVRLLAWLEGCQQGQFLGGTEKDVGERIHRLGGKSSYVRNSVPVDGSVPLVDSSMDGLSEPYSDPTTMLPESVRQKFESEEEFQLWLERVCDITDEILYLSNRHSKNHSSGCIRTHGRLRYCRGRFPRVFNAESYIDERGAIHLQHKEQWLNTFHWVLTYVLRCNLDVTALLSGTMVKAIIAYVTDYITKSSLRTHMIFDAIRSVLQNHVVIRGDSESAVEQARHLVTRVVNVLTSRMEMGGPMISAFLLGNGDHYTNRVFKVVFWKTYVSFVENAWQSYYESKLVVGDAREHHDDEDDFSEKVLLSRGNERIIALSRVNDYVYRPLEYATYSLYDFLQLTDIGPSESLPESNVPLDEIRTGTFPKVSHIQRVFSTLR